MVITKENVSPGWTGTLKSLVGPKTLPSAAFCEGRECCLTQRLESSECLPPNWSPLYGVGVTREGSEHRADKAD